MDGDSEAVIRQGDHQVGLIKGHDEVVNTTLLKGDLSRFSGASLITVVVQSNVVSKDSAELIKRSSLIGLGEVKNFQVARRSPHDEVSENLNFLSILIRNFESKFSNVIFLIIGSLKRASPSVSHAITSGDKFDNGFIEVRLRGRVLDLKSSLKISARLLSSDDTLVSGKNVASPFINFLVADPLN